jgi:hypothetical protein
VLDGPQGHKMIGKTSKNSDGKNGKIEIVLERM